MSGSPAAPRTRKVAVRRFASAAERACAENLDQMIARAKSENPLDVDDWDASFWSFPHRSRGSSAGEGGLWFTISRATRAGGKDPFPPRYMAFVKALVCRYEARSTRGYAAAQSQQLIRAAAYLYHELPKAEDDVDPTSITAAHLTRAAEKARGGMGAGAKNIGSKLAFIAETVTRHVIVPVALSWRNPIKSSPKHDRIGEAADARRRKFMPAPEVLDALADISARDDLDARDLVIQRVIDLLVCGGFRVNEVLTMPRDCIVEEPVLDEDGEPMLDRFGNPAWRLGLRYWPEKLGHLETRVKPIPTVMREIAKRAIADVLTITAPYAGLALYQKLNPGRTRLGEPWDSLSPATKLRSFDVGRALKLLGGRTDDRQGLQRSANQYLGNKSAPITRFKDDEGFFVLKTDLEEHLRGRSMSGNVLRAGEGTQDLAACLFVVPHRFPHRYHEAGVPGTVQLVKDAMIDVYLGGLLNESQKSIFDRLGYVDGTGAPLQVESHGFRHWLNTLAVEGSMLEHEIARWFGRRDLKQNGAYDHMTGVERARRLREAMQVDGGAVGPLVDVTARINDPQRRAEFIVSTTSTAHLTDYGVCVHPWDVLPCPKHGACAGCNELRIIKGDQASRERAGQQLGTVRAQLAIAREAMDDEEWGADRWVEAHERTMYQLERIVEVHGSDLADGTIVQIPQSASQISEAAPEARQLNRR